MLGIVEKVFVNEHPPHTLARLLNKSRQRMVKFVLLEKICTFHIIKKIDDTKNGPNIQLLIPPR